MCKMYNVCLSSLEHPIRPVCKQESMPRTQLEPVVLVLRVEQLILSAERPSQITAAVREH